MKFLLEFKSYKKPSYNVGDIVLIEYWYLDESSCPSSLHSNLSLTPVEIIEKLSNVSYKVSHNISKSKISNAPDEIIKSKDIIDRHR